VRPYLKKQTTTTTKKKHQTPMARDIGQWNRTWSPSPASPKKKNAMMQQAIYRPKVKFSNAIEKHEAGWAKEDSGTVVS
jgi:hypothetical protein